MSKADGGVIGTTQLVAHGAKSVRLNLVILGDGFKFDQLGKYATAADQVVRALFETKPINELRHAINVFRVDVWSVDEGADDPADCPSNPGTGAKARSYFDSSFCSWGVSRSISIDVGLALDVVKAQVPEYQPGAIVLLVNTTKDGGSAGGGVGRLSLASGLGDTAVHELGHSLFGLADEYQYHLGPGLDTDRDRYLDLPRWEPWEPNVTTETNPDKIKWRNQLSSGVTLPTTSNPDCTSADVSPYPQFAALTGAFEGAFTYHCQVYRPQVKCTMSSRGDFCTVCTLRVRQTLAPFFPWLRLDHASTVVFQDELVNGTVNGAPSIAQSGHGNNQDAVLQMVVPLTTGVLEHWYTTWYDDYQWHRGSPMNLPFPVVSASLLAGSLGHAYDAEGQVLRRGNLELFVRQAGSVAIEHFTRGWEGAMPWVAAGSVFGFEGQSSAIGAPSFIQSDYGNRGNFEGVTPVLFGGVAACFRDNDDPLPSWHPDSGGTPFGNDVQSVALAQGQDGLEIVVVAGGRLFASSRGGPPAWAWSGVVEINTGGTGAVGTPGLMRGGDGLLHLVAATSDGRVRWYRRDAAQGTAWETKTEFHNWKGAPPADSVALTMGTGRLMADPNDPSARGFFARDLHVIVRAGNKLYHYRHDVHFGYERIAGDLSPVWVRLPELALE